MTIVVTGGAGFIGSHLCDRLIKAEERVICVDSLFTGSKANIQHLIAHPNFVFKEHDIVEPLIIDEKIDQIYNLACPAAPVHYQHNPVHTIKTSTIGVINMLGLARAHQAVILQSSTSEVYGEPLVHPQTEEYRGNVNTIGPRACYDESKRCAEALFFDYKRMHHLRIKVIRIFNTYGPRMALNDGRVVSNFIIQALKNEAITLDGDGSQTRSFCYVDDLVEGMIRMMNTSSDITGPVNLGNPVEMTVKSLAQEIKGLTGSVSDIVTKGSFRTDDPMQRCPDISKAKKLLGWEPKTDQKDGLYKTIEFFRNALKQK